jgi:hypothetical protein
MTVVPLGVSSFKRTLAHTPEVLLMNMFVESDPTNLIDKIVRLQRPALVPFGNVGNGPIRGMFQEAGIFGGKFIVVSGPQLALVNSDGVKTPVSGEVEGSGRVSIAANKLRTLIATGGKLYMTDGVTLTTVATPDDVPMSAVAEMNGYFLISQTNSQRIYFIPPGATTIDALDFFSAENSADNVVTLKTIGDELWALGESSIEPFSPTGGADLPFARLSGRVYPKGCANRDTAVPLDNSLFWVGSDKIVYRADTVPQRVSDNGIEERLRKADATGFRAWAYALDGHTFYVLTIGTQGTFAFDVSTQTWCQFQTYGRETWRAHLGTQSDGSLIVAGDDTTGQLWRLDPEASTDDGEPIIRELTGAVPVIGKPVRCNNFHVRVSTGHVKPGLIPKLMLTISDDEGQTWDDWRYIELPPTGVYNFLAAEWGLGLMREPGRVFKLRMTDDCVARISYSRINEAFAA